MGCDPVTAWVLSRWSTGRCMTVTTQLHVAPALQMGGAIPPLPYTRSWRGQEQPYFYLYLPG